MSPHIPARTIISHAMPWWGGGISSFLWNFRKRMKLGVAALSMVSLATYSSEADADNVTETPNTVHNCGAVRGLHELDGNSTVSTIIVSGAGAGYATIVMRGFGSIDGCYGAGIGGWTDIFHMGFNGPEIFSGCMLATKHEVGTTFNNSNGATWYFQGGAWVSITIPLTFVNGPNTLGSWWSGAYDDGVSGEGYCIESLTINHPPRVTPPPPLLTATPTPGSPSGPGTTVPPQPASTPAPVPLECGVVAGTTPAPVCVNGNCSAPSGFRYQCNSTYDVLTFTWDAHAGAKGYNLRLNFKGNDTATCTDGWYCPGSADENITGTANTSYSFDVIPGAEYKAWIQYVGSDGKESGMQIYDPIVCKAP